MQPRDFGTQASREQGVVMAKSAAPSAEGLYERGARVVSVFGAFASRVLVEMPTSVAETLFSEPLSKSGRTSVVAAVERDLALLRTRDSALAESALAASALALAYEIEHPYNSATSKSMCVKALVEALGDLRTLAPAEEEKDGLDDLAAQRKKRLADRARRPAPADSASS